MGDYFNPWRVVTLVLACVVMLAWVDSFNGDLTFDLEHCGGMTAGTTSIGIFQHSVEFRETLIAYRKNRSEAMYDVLLPKAEKVFSIPLWSVAVPLTLVSAWLLFSNPRKPSQVKPVEPFAEQVE